MMRTTGTLFLLAAFWIATLTMQAEESLTRREWKVDNITREALVYVPANAKTNDSPVVFVFHGHGGTMRHSARTFDFHTLWPEAIVVYMQGLNTPGRLSDSEGKKPGWQHSVGAQENRDLKFFDVVLGSLKKDYKVNAKCIYATGHSNGGAFTYLLWEARAKEFAAFAPSGSLSLSLVEDHLPFAQERVRRKSASTNDVALAKTNSVTDRDFISKPVLHVAGENDPLVKFQWQKRMLDALRKLNQCGEGKPWDADKRCTIYPSEGNAPVVTYIYPGGHDYPEEASAMIVKFFKAHPQATR